MINALERVLRARKTVMTLLVVIFAAGVVSYLNVPKEANPDIDIPVFYVSVGQQGISPRDAERLLVRPMETHLRGLDGLKEITTISAEGYAAAILEFEVGFEKAKVLADVRDKVDQAKAEFPASADEPKIQETNFNLVPTIIVTLSGNVPERTLLRYARLLEDEIESIPSVLEANLSGQRDELLEVIIDQMRLESYDITQNELLNTLTRNNQLVPAGFRDGGSGRFNVKVPGLIETAQDVYSLPIKVFDEGVVTLSDVADIRRTFKDPTRITYVNGKPAISLSVIKRSGENVIENNQRVREVVAEATRDWPQTIQIGFILDQSAFIEDVLGSLESAILTAIFLVMIVVLAAMGLRSSFLVGISIPISFMTGFLILNVVGMTVNMMVMFGLVLTVGMLVDAAIVITEYADRKISEGLTRKDAYIRAAKLMFWPVVSSTATTLAAFLPMLLWPGVSGEFMSYLPTMVVIVLSASLLTAMVFLPVMGSLMGRKGPTEEEKRAIEREATEGFSVERITGLTGAYVRFMSHAIRRPLVVIASVGMIIFGVITLFSANPPAVEFFVDEEPTQSVVLVSARGNLSAVEARSLVGEVEAQLLQVSGIKDMVVTSYPTGGGGGGGPADQMGGVQDKPRDLIGEVTLEFLPYRERRKAELIFAEIRERTAPIAGIHVELRMIEGGPPTGKDINLEIRSSSYALLSGVTERLRNHFETVEGLIDIEDGRPLPGIEWEIIVDREQAGRFGASIAEVGPMVQLMTNGVLIGTYRPDDSDDEVDIRVRLPEDQRNLSALDELRLRTPNGLVPLGNFTERQPQQRVSDITRKDGLYVMSVKANMAPGVVTDQKVREIQGWLDTQEFPQEISFRFRGADEEQNESAAFLGGALMASLFLMFIILVTQFNSFYQTFLTLLTVILSTFGVLLGMVLTGQAFSVIMTGTGIVALAGIVVNNAIVLIDTYNRLHRIEGLPVMEAVLKTAHQRVRPVLLTTVTTVCGLIPMALQITIDFFTPAILIGGITSIWWVQLSTAIIFGLSFATILTLVLIPALLAAPYVWAHSWAGKQVGRGWRKARLKLKGTPVRQFGRREEGTPTPEPFRTAAE